jgi:hypothetical protein
MAKESIGSFFFLSDSEIFHDKLLASVLFFFYYVSRGPVFMFITINKHWFYKTKFQHLDKFGAL